MHDFGFIPATRVWNEDAEIIRLRRLAQRRFAAKVIRGGAMLRERGALPRQHGAWAASSCDRALHARRLRRSGPRSGQPGADATTSYRRWIASEGGTPYGWNARRRRA